MENKLLAILNINNTVSIGILGFDYLDDKVKFCWINNQKEGKVISAQLKTSKYGHAYFVSKGKYFYINDFKKVSA